MHGLLALLLLHLGCVTGEYLNPIAGTCDGTVCEDLALDPMGEPLNRHIRTIGAARPTAAVLVATNPNILGLEIASSEFRNAHDGVQVWGTDTDVHDSLFENLNDEALLVENPLANGINVKVHHNLIRSVLHAFDHDVGTGQNAIRPDVDRRVGTATDMREVRIVDPNPIANLIR